MSPDHMIAAVLEQAGLPAEGSLADQLGQLTAELSYWAPQLGLSTLADETLVLTRHVLDSLLLAQVVERPTSMLDIGTGAGLPAIPLAMAWPMCQVVAMDGKRKSHWFVSRMASQFGLENLKHLCCRADSSEATGAVSEVDLVTCRGLAQVDRALTLCRPFRRQGGCTAVLGGPDLDERPLAEGEALHVAEIPGTDWRRRILVEHGRPGTA